MRRVLALVLLAALLGGCGESSRVDRDAEVRISGSVTAPGGAPLAGRPVRLGSALAADDAGLALLTVGLSCAGGGCRGKVFDASTDARGAYAFTVQGRDTQGSLGTVRRQLVSVSAAPGDGQVSGASATAEFVVQTERVTLPRLALEDPGLRLEDRAPSVLARWSTRRAGPLDLGFETASPVPVWRQRATGWRAALDARVLEDASGQVVLSGRSTDRIQGSEVALGWRSPGTAFASAAGAPPSRAARCRWSRPGALTTDATCGLTDGDLVEAADAPPVCAPGQSTAAPNACPPPSTVTVLLAGPLRPDLLVLRGCGSGCPVSTSSDGKAFRPVGTGSGDHAALRLDRRPVVAVQVALRGQGLREVSVWEPLPTGPVLRPVREDALDRLRSPYQREPGRRWWLYGVAAALVLAAAVTAAFQLGRQGRAAGQR